MKRKLLMAGLLLGMGAASAQMKNPDTLVTLTFGDWGTGFDPAYCYDSACGNVLENTLETLFGLQGTSASKIEPLLAAEIPTKANGGISADGKTYTVKLRKNARFSDGTPVTAQDVEYSLERMMVYSTDVGPAGLLLEPLLGSADLIRKGGKVGYDAIDKAVETRGNDTVVFKLAKPFGPFLNVLAFYGASVYSKNAAVKAGDWSGTARDWEKFNNAAEGSSAFAKTGMVGSGPFTIERYDVGKNVVLKRNDRYWRPVAKLNRVIIQSVADETTRIQMLRSGDADMANQNAISNPQLATVEKIPGVKVSKVPILSLVGMFLTHKIDGTGTNYLGSGKLDGKGIPSDFFSDKNVRKAFAYSFDYNTMVKDVLAGIGSQQNTVLVKGLTGYNAAAPKYKFDKALATKYFQAAWGGKVWENGFTLPVFFNSGNTTRQRALEILKRNIESINPKFKIEVRELQFSQILSQSAAHKMTVWLGGWGADFADTHSFAQPFLHSAGNYPQNMNYKNAQLDKLIDQAVAESNPAARTKIYTQIARLGFEEVPLIPIYQAMGTYVHNGWVKGRQLNPMYSSDYYYTISKSN
ncbi:peptide/nickel transport system substrate-binding protein [Deinobacterium chartae]|uniref:Peptide/nickel transport system substrate-binding protein n=1 Tax=Deinobacterium chartae TaxID=521158 RepID=A0A841I543_9DEIO|nr:ABC transporter substrate-binding protein [Deinobacterium chartae]MBB6099550.1 peptide/nickel transport system substrate-binding protein [Deinobacterium chartae]